MIKGQTTSGFKFSLPDKVMDNMELLDALVEMDEDETKTVAVINLILDQKQKQKLYDHVRAKDGRVPTEAAMKEFAEILQISITESGKTGKN